MAGGLKFANIRELRVCEEAMKLAAHVHRATARFPRHEVYGLSQPIGRAAGSVPGNIAEGRLADGCWNCGPG